MLIVKLYLKNKEVGLEILGQNSPQKFMFYET